MGQYATYTECYISYNRYDRKYETVHEGPGYSATCAQCAKLEKDIERETSVPAN